MDVSFLQPLYRASGPCATVCLASGKHTESAARELEVTWRHLREELASAGCPEDTLSALEAEVQDVISGPAAEGLILAAADDELLLRHDLLDPPSGSTASAGPLPHLTEMIRQGGRRRPHMVVTVDRLGAVLHGYGPLGEDLVSRGETGGDLHIAKVKVGGWRQSQYQRRSENIWEANAAQVAADVERAVAVVEPELIVLAGDVRARGLLVEHLPPPLAERVEVVNHPGDIEPTSEVVDQVVRAAAHHHAVAVLDELREEIGRGGAASTGLPDTCSALRRSQVRTLILDEALLGEPPQVFVGADLTQIATTPVDITGEARPVPADDALLRAAVGSGARVLAPGEPTGLPDGVGAVLRYSDAATP